MKSPIGFLVRGFTVIEVVFVLGLLGVAALLTVLFGFDAIARQSAISERDLAVTFLETARAEALANIDESAHGLHIDDSVFVLFTGTSYDPGDASNRPYDRSATISYTGPSEVVFEPLSGEVSTGAGTLTFTDNAANATIDVNAEGRIDW